VLVRSEIQVLNRVGPATVLGNLFRQYWHPFLTSAELQPRARPVRVRLMGESLVAYRDDQGQVALVGEVCSHAGASLAFAQNEGDGIRCLFHDWKFDATGHCVDLPGLVPGSGLLVQAKIKGYRCAEQGGLVFAYLGPHQVDPPRQPSLPWSELPTSYFQHDRYPLPQSWARTLADELHPGHATEPRAPDGNPSFTMPLNLALPYSPDGERCLDRLVPIDDEHTLVWRLRWEPARPLAEITHRPARPREDPDPYAFPEESESPLLQAYLAIVDAARALREEGAVPPGVHNRVVP
jgi:nitrite reductase/ring-hydroxylating ferredoxin subunit